MKVSVITPTYNRAPMLRECIESFLNQDYKNSEMILFNNGSTDNTQEIIDEYKSNRRIVWVSSNFNLVPPSNFNEMLQYCSGDLICYLHDDDRFTENSLSIRVKEFQNDHELQVLYAGWTTNGKTYPGQQPDLNRLLREEYINYTTMMFRKDVNMVLDEDLRYYHDWLHKIECLTKYKVKAIPDPVMNYTIHLGQASIECRKLGMNGPEEQLMRQKLKEKYNL